MGKRIRRTRIAAGCLAGVTCVSPALAATGCGGASASAGTRSVAAARFLTGYVRADGRVVRRDQGGDTVSEGQAYGMLLAEANGDHAAFGRIWRWTRAHLQLGDGLFAFHADAAGQVVGNQPASDADLLIAWALLRYRGPRSAAYHRAGRRVAAAILAHEVTNGPGGGPVLTAGPWATGRPASLDPSYWSLPALLGLAGLTGDSQWRRLAASAVTLTRSLTQNGRALPPDWAKLTAAGAVLPEPAPNGSQPQTQYGLDAERVVVWFAVSCDPRARALAARWWPLLSRGGRSGASALRTSGSVLDPDPAVLPMVASAAAATAAGHPSVAGRLLRQAARRQQTGPTYYGGAWSALGSVLLSGRARASC